MTQKGKNAIEDSPLVAYCRSNPTYEDALARYPHEIFEEELKGLIEVKNGRVSVI